MKRITKSVSVLLLTMTMIMGQSSFGNLAVYAAQDVQEEVTQEDFSDTTEERSLDSLTFSERDINDLKQFNAAPIYDVKSNKMLLPRIEGYTVELFGSDRKETVALNGDVTRPLNTQNVQLLYKITNKSDGSVVTTEKNAVVKIPGQNFSFAGNNEKPTVFPDLREWVGADGTITVDGRIVIDNDALEATAHSFKEDFEDMTGRSITIVKGDESSLKSGDVFFTLDEECPSLAKEGYYLEIGGADTSKGYVVVRANQTTGALYGGISILQILKQEDGRDELPKGIVRDYPLFERRGMHLDVARKWIPMSYLKDVTKQMSWYKLNMINMHLTDNDIWDSLSTEGGTDPEGFYRLECETFPALVSEQHYTKEEFREYQRYSADMGIDVIPELDTPGHALSYTDAWPELSLPGKPKYLDVTKPQVLENMKMIYDEYINGYEGGEPTFIGNDVNVGTDEYKVSGKEYKEAFRAYTDALLKYIKAEGKNPIFWGSLTENAGDTPVTTDATMFAWYQGYANAKQSLNAGYKIISMEDMETYIVPGGGYYSNQFGRSEYLYNSWTPNNNSGWAGSPAPAGHPGVIGGQFAVWNDFTGNGISVDDISYRIQHNLYTVAEKCWSGAERKNNGTDYKQFEAKATALGDAPNTDFLYRDSIETEDNEVLKLDDTIQNETKKDTGIEIVNDKNVSEQVDGKNGKAIAFNGGESYLESDAVSTGFGWTNAMWLKLDQSNPENATLMEGKTGTLRIENGKIKYDIEQYTHTFDYTIPTDTWTHVALSGTYEGVKLYIDGKFIDELKDKPYPNYNFNSGCNSWNGSYPSVDGKNTQRYYETLMLPLNVLGSKTNAVKASIDEWNIYNRVLDQDEISALAGKAPEETKVNLALKKTVTASGSETASFGPEKAVDGDLKTRWSSPTSPTAANDAWFMVDLGANKNINNVKIKWEDAYAVTYKVLVSTDGNEFKEVYFEENGKGGTSDISFDMQSARYVKFQGINRRTDNQWIEAYSFYEFEVYGEDTVHTPKKNIALNKPVTTTYYNDSGIEGDRAGSKAVDGILDTRWEFKQGRTDANTITIPVNKDEDVNKILITERLWGSETTRISKIKVEAVIDGEANKELLAESAYTPDKTPSGSPRHGEKTISFDTVKASAIKITLTPKAAGGDDLVNIAEIAMYGTVSEEETPIPPVEDTYTKLSHKTMSVFATDEHPNVGSEGLAAFAIDDNPGTMWHTNYNNHKGLPQSITLDLKSVKTIGKYAYLPRTSGNNGNITTYELQASIDNVNYETIAAGNWANSSVEKVLTFAPVNARYLRLTATAGVGNFASAAELNAFTTDKVTLDALTKAIANAKAIDLNLYLNDSKAALEQAITSAEQVVAGTPDDAAILAANKALTSAINGLKLKGNKSPLQALYDDKVNLNKDDYTVGSYTEFKAVLEDVKALLDSDDNVSQNDIDTLTDALTAKETELVSIVNLKAFITEAEGLSLEDCTLVSGTKVRVALANAKAQLLDDNATLYSVTKAQYDLQDAIAEAQPDATTLRTLIQSYEDNQAQYTADSWTAFTTALDEAKAVMNKENATINELYNARMTLSTKAEEILVKKDASPSFVRDILKGVINKTEGYVADGKLDTLAPYAKALITLRLAEANAIYANVAATDTECLTAWLNLADALHYLDFEANKADLKKLIDSCANINTDDYKDGVEEYLTALDNAKAVYDDEKALQKRINEAYQTLETAIANLVKNDVADKSTLTLLVNMIETTVGDGSAYKKDDAWTKFQNALANAKNILADDKATQEQVSNAFTTLADTFEDVRLIPDEAILKELTTFVAIIDQLDARLYSAENNVYFQDTRAMIVDLMENYTPEAYANAQKVMSDVLKKITDEKNATPQEPVETEKPVVDASEPTNEEAITPKAPATKVQGTTKTGDMTNLAGLSAMMIAGVSIMYTIRRKKQTKK